MDEIEKRKATALQFIELFAPQKESPKVQSTQALEEKLLSLSYYHIDDYLACSLKYKYVNILRVPIMEHHTVIYGRAMHEAVSKYFQFKLAGKKMTETDLLNSFQESFDPQGFLDEKHQQERFHTKKSQQNVGIKHADKGVSALVFLLPCASFASATGYLAPP